jgi:hypothetical protein
VFLCGTELEQLSQVYSIRWDFSHLDEAVQQGFLAPGKSSHKRVFHFGQTEPQMIPDGNRTTVVPIPVIISIETDVDLPSSESFFDTYDDMQSCIHACDSIALLPVQVWL